VLSTAAGGMLRTSPPANACADMPLAMVSTVSLVKVLRAPNIDHVSCICNLQQK
jgi:hypothetical protein